VLSSLLSQTKSGYDFSITLDVLFAHILEQSRSVANHFQQTASRRVVFAMNLEMFGQFIDPSGQNRYLHLGRARISVMGLEITDYLLFFLPIQHLTNTSFHKKPLKTGFFAQILYCFRLTTRRGSQPGANRISNAVCDLRSHQKYNLTIIRGPALQLQGFFGEKIHEI
jgi:hypothetical protein